MNPDGTLYVGLSHGVCPIYAPDPDPKNNEPPSCGVGNPINPGTGDKYQEELDYPGTGGLRFIRHYHSSITAASGSVGSHWRHNFESLIYSDGSTVARVMRASGKQVVYRPSGTAWASDADINDQLVRLPDGRWQLTTANDDVETYDSTGKLSVIKDRSGYTQNLNYTTAPTADAPLAGLLDTVTDSYNHTLKFTYDNQSRVATVTLLDDAGQATSTVYRYGYDASGNLTSVTYPDSTPGSLADNPKRSYTYNEAAYTKNTDLPHALTGIFDENNNRYATFNYAADGKAVSTEHAGGVEKYQVAYGKKGSDGECKTDGSGTGESCSMITDPLLTAYTRNFTTVQGMVKSTGQSQPAATSSATSCPASSSNLRYDANGNILQRTDFNGNTTCYAYDTARNLETVRVEGIAPNSPLLDVDPNNTAAKVCPSNFSSLTLSANERKITTQWHTRFRVPIKKAEPERLTTWDWGDSTNPNTTQCGKNGNTTVVADGVLCSKTVQSTNDATGGTGLAAAPISTRKWLYTYNPFGQTLSVDGPRNNNTDVADKTIYAYYLDSEINVYNRRMLKSVTNALGQVTTYISYDAHGRPTQIMAANDVVTQLAYTPRGQLQTVTTAAPSTAGRSTQLTYYANSLLESVTSPATGTTTYFYDDAHRLKSIKNAAGEKIAYILDNLGNHKKDSTLNSDGTTATAVNRRFDNLGRLWKLLNAASQVVSEYNYDPNGNLTATTDYPDGTAANKQQTFSGYDALDRMDLLTDALDGLTTYDYDGLGQLTQVKDPRANSTASPRPNGTGFTTDGLGNQRQENSQDRGVTNNTGFDPAGNLKTRIDARNTTTQYTYDALDRLLTDSTYLADANGAAQATTVDSTISYRYDLNTADLTANPAAKNAVGQLSHVDDPSGSTDWQYDGEGRLQAKTHSISTAQASRNLSVSYTYDAISGRVATMTYPSGFTVRYSYDPAGRPSQLAYAQSPTDTFTTLLDAIAYQPWGGVNSYTLSTVTGTPIISRDFDSDGRIEGYTLNTGTKKLAYDRIGNVTQLGDGLFTDTTVSNANNYVYDGLGRLTDFTPFTGTAHHYGYDASGNRTEKTVGSQTLYTPDDQSNRLDWVGAAPYSYDAAGNLTANGSGPTFGYDSRNRLASLTNTSGTVTYQYGTNALGQRVSKTDTSPTGTNSRFYAYDEAGHLLGEYGTDGSRQREHLWLGDQPVAVVNGSGGVFLVLTDHLNTPRQIIDTSNRLRWQWDFSDPIGGNAANGKPDASLTRFDYNLRFPGQYFDAETGLFYNVFRSYDPKVGRYTQSDPIGIDGGVNTFGYVGGNPVNYADPLGLARCTYVISRHTLICVPNSPSPFEGPPLGLGPDGVFSGVEECQNNNACTNESKKGPIPPGNYNMNPDNRPHHDNFWRLEPNPKIPGWKCRLNLARCGFELHPGLISLGCITASKENPTVMGQYNNINDLLRRESGNNTLEVIP
ncbi:MAG: hypothetical protein CTY16_10540 [Methylobacter sp.]|nr:MAG: hypothetical protein CTY16_10540 [Methylobacter sp.]